MYYYSTYNIECGVSVCVHVEEGGGESRKKEEEE